MLATPINFLGIFEKQVDVSPDVLLKVRLQFTDLTGMKPWIEFKEFAEKFKWLPGSDNYSLQAYLLYRIFRAVTGHRDD